MQLITDHYKLVVTSRYVRLDQSRKMMICPRCNGTGKGCDDWQHLGFGDKGYTCDICMGSGETEVSPPPPPEISKKFLEDLQNWVNNYEG